MLSASVVAGSSWSAHVSNLRAAGLCSRLSADYEFASRQVAHFNAERVPAEDSPIFEPVDGARLRRHADDAFAAMSAFAQHLSATGSEYAGDFGEWLALAKGRR